jgi:L-fuconolactonase
VIVDPRSTSARDVPIDAHQHFWRYDPAEYRWIDDSMASLRRDFLPGHLQPLLEASGFAGCIAVQVRQTLEETEWLLDLADRHSFIRGVVGWVDLQADDLRGQLERLAPRRRLVGIRHIVQDEPDERFLLRKHFCRGIALLAEFSLTYDILIHPRHLPVAHAFVERFPGQRFVLDHLAKPEIVKLEIHAWEADLRRLAAFPNVSCKLSGLVTEADWQGWTPGDLRPYLDVAYDAFGPQRLMIGSDWPVCTVAADYARTVGVVQEYLEGRPRDERSAVLGGNARRFWQLDREELRT